MLLSSRSTDVEAHTANGLSACRSCRTYVGYSRRFAAKRKNANTRAPHFSISLGSLRLLRSSASLRKRRMDRIPHRQLTRAFGTIRVVAHGELDPSVLLKNYISVTNFSTQYDERRQLRIANGLEIQKQTPSLAKGTAIHAKLEESSIRSAQQKKIFEELSLGMGSIQEVQFLRCLDLTEKFRQLESGLSVRELKVRGLIGRYKLSGIIDGLEFENDQIVIVENKTTSKDRIEEYQIRLAWHQTLFYWAMLHNLIVQGPGNLQHMMGIEDASMLEEYPAPFDLKPMWRVLSELEEAICSFRSSNKTLADYVELRFRNVSTNAEDKIRLPFDRATLEDVYKFRTDLFEGRRSPLPSSLVRLNLGDVHSDLSSDPLSTPLEESQSLLIGIKQI